MMLSCFFMLTLLIDFAYILKTIIEHFTNSYPGMVFVMT